MVKTYGVQQKHQATSHIQSVFSPDKNHFKVGINVPSLFQVAQGSEAWVTWAAQDNDDEVLDSGLVYHSLKTMTSAVMTSSHTLQGDRLSRAQAITTDTKRLSPNFFESAILRG